MSGKYPNILVKIFSILMIATMSLLLLGLYPALKVLQYQAAERMEDSIKQNLPIQQLTAFSDIDSNPAIVWEKADEEFRFKGAMYDVARIEIHNGKKTYYCLSDEKETKVCDLINKVLTTQQGNTLLNPNAQKLLKIFIQVFTPCERYRQTISGPDFYYTFFTDHKSGYYVGCCLNIVTPPPRLC
ncbi:MAG: hypothetical protein P4L41_06420 [Flavipsychrobacter sp.]|nr:hypothetical protein [Flavipsychrobacter sp.]